MHPILVILTEMGFPSELRSAANCEARRIAKCKKSVFTGCAAIFRTEGAKNGAFYINFLRIQAGKTWGVEISKILAIYAEEMPIFGEISVANFAFFL
jgi:hypothetical protein